MTVMTPSDPDATFVCIASGPSLTEADVRRCHPARIIAISNAISLCPTAYAVYSAEKKWWAWHEELARAPAPPLR